MDKESPLKLVKDANVEAMNEGLVSFVGQKEGFGQDGRDSAC